MKNIHPIAVSALVVQLMLQGAATGWAETLPWQEAVSRLTSERNTAEVCVAQLKKYGNDTQKASGERAYAGAKKASDAVIDGLIAAALSGGGTPGELQARLSSSVSSNVSELAAFCGAVSKLIREAAGQKGRLDDIAITVEVLVTRLLDGIAALSTYYSSNDDLMRRSIRTGLESARWPQFSEVKADQ